MQINLIADSSVSSAPAGFTTAIAAAAAVYEAAFAGNYTVNIRYGWGTYDDETNSQLTGAQISLGGVIGSGQATYAQVKTWLTDDATLTDQQTALESLPASYTSLPNQADDFFVSSAEEKALGVYTGSSDAIDGAIGFGTDSYNWEGLALCEIGHALGWMTDYYVNEPAILDLFRFNSAGQREWTGGQPAYFSLDDGKTDLANFATSFDYTLFTNLTDDPFDAPVGPDTLSLTALDKEVLNVIGFGGSGRAGPNISISDAYALPGTDLEVVAGVRALPANTDSISLLQGAVTLATSDPQVGAHWAFATSLAAGSHTLMATATDAEDITGASPTVTISSLGGASLVHTDTAADLQALTAGEIATLAQSGVTTLASSDATLVYDSAQSAALNAAGMSVTAPAGDRVRENLSDGTILIFDYGANGALSEVVTHEVDGTTDRRLLGRSGAVNNIGFSGYDVFLDATGAGLEKQFLNAEGGEVATVLFSGGGFSFYDQGTLEIKHSAPVNGTFDVFRYNHSGFIGGLAFDATDTSYGKNGLPISVDYYEGDDYLGFKLINADRSVEFESTPVTGRSYTTFQIALASDDALIGQSFDYSDTSGAVNVYGSGLSVSTKGSYGSAAAPAEFFFSPHVSETYTFIGGDETLAVQADFGAATLDGFATGDTVNLSQVFSTYAAATAAMTSSSAGVSFIDAAGDVLTLAGVDPASLSAARLGFA